MQALTELMEGFLRRGKDDIHLENGPNDYGEEGEEEVVEGDGPGEPEGLSWAHIVEAVHELGGCEDHVLVEEVEDHLGDPHVVQSPVVEQQFPQEAELSNRVISHLCGSCALLTENTHTDVGLHDHVYIVGAVPDCQGELAHVLH